MTLSEMKRILLAGDIRLAKSLGQNFLHDANQLQRIVAAAELGEGDQALEVGPGLGPLTVLLLASAGRVPAIEKDRRPFENLVSRLGAAKNLPPLHDDALDSLPRRPAGWLDWELAANLPSSRA